MRVIDGTGALRIESDSLLVRGQIDYIGDGFLSIMGQTLFDNGSGFAGLTVGATIAVFGAIDSGSGGFVDTQIVKMAPVGIDAGVADFLRETVDAVDLKLGIAVVDGMTVDYTAMLANGYAPVVGEQIAVSGRNYRDLGLLVASP